MGFFRSAIIIQIVSAKANGKIRGKNYFVWHSICCCQFGRGFGTRFAEAAILAVGARRLPFWQLPRLPLWQALTAQFG